MMLTSVVPSPSSLVGPVWGMVIEIMRDEIKKRKVTELVHACLARLGQGTGRQGRQGSATAVPEQSAWHL